MTLVSNPFSAFLAAFSPKRFVGRQKEIETILKGVSAQEPSSFAIDGSRTVGKTSLLKYLCHPQGAIIDHPNILVEFGVGRPGKLRFKYINFNLIHGPELLHILYKEVMKLMNDIGINGQYTDDIRQINKPEIKKKLKESFVNFQEQNIRLVICFDHFDKTFQSVELEDESYLRSLIDHASFVISTEKSLFELSSERAKLESGYFSPLYNAFMSRHIGLLSHEEATQLICSPLEGLDNIYQFTPNEVCFLLQLAGLHPYILTLSCEFLFDLHIQQPDISGLLADSDNIKQRVNSRF